VEAPERTSQKHRHQQRARPRNQDVNWAPQIKRADLAYQQVADGNIERPPKHVHCRGGEPLARRLRKRTLKRPPQHSAYAVRNGIGEKSAAEEITQVVVPRHIYYNLIRAFEQRALLSHALLPVLREALNPGEDRSCI
jgi:hypothetical protein